MIGTPILYLSDALDKPNPPTPRPGIITGPGMNPGEVNVTVFLDLEKDVRGRGVPPMVQRSSLALIRDGDPRPPGCSEWAVICGMPDRNGEPAKDPDESDTAHHPFVPSAADPCLCDTCGEHASWHPGAKVPDAADPSLVDLSEPIVHGQLTGPMADVIKAGQAEPKAVRWETATAQTYRGLSPHAGMPLFLLTHQGKGRYTLYAATYQGRRGAKLQAFDGAPFPAMLDFADQLAADTLAANQEAEKEAGAA